MLRSWKIGKAFGIGVYVHWTFLVLLAIVYYVSGAATRQGAHAAANHAIALFSVTLVLSVFVCVLLHEFGHALMARHFGIPTRDITLLPIGGVARMERMSEKPWEEICIAVAGPAVNVAIAGLLLGGGTLLGVPLLRSPEGHMNSMSQFFQAWMFFLICSNVILLLFNMLPLFPMDGGRVFRALLSSVIGLRAATEVAAAVSLVLASAMGIYGLYLNAKSQFSILPLVAIFVVFAGQQELAAVRQRTARKDGPAIDVLPATGPYFQASLTPPEPSFSGFTWDRQQHVWIEWRDGRAVHACRIASE